MKKTLTDRMAKAIDSIDPERLVVFAAKVLAVFGLAALTLTLVLS